MMNYDRRAIGQRIRTQREQLGITREQFAERLGRVPKFCADIERGQCGMSIDTLLLIASTLKMSLDYIVLGTELPMDESNYSLLISMLNNCKPEKRVYAEELLKLFLMACN